MKKKTTSIHHFSDFLSEPLVAAGLLVFALIALVLTVLEFGQAMSY